jgi:hypothetical protein
MSLGGCRWMIAEPNHEVALREISKPKARNGELVFIA